MKFLLVLVFLVAVLTVDGRDFNPEPDIQNTADHDFDAVQVESEGSGLQDSDEENRKLKEVNEQHIGRSKRSRCKARNACVVMGGFCVTNGTLCSSGRLVPEGCKGTNCQCCIPGTIEANLENLEQEFQSLKESMNNSIDSLNSEVQSVNHNVYYSNKELQSLNESMKNRIASLNSEVRYLNHNVYYGNTELQSLKESMNNSIDSLNSEVQSVNHLVYDSNTELQSIKQSITSLNSEVQSVKSIVDDSNTELQSIKANIDSLENQGCPDGYFLYSASNQCFRYFGEAYKRSWTDAKSYCTSVGGVLAKPLDPIGLRQYLVLRYGSWSTWIGARGAGSSIAWDRDAVTVESSLPHWWPGHPGSRTSSYHCLLLLVSSGNMKSYPEQPYYMNGCTSSHPFVCEYLKK